MAAGRRGGLPEELFLLSWALTDGQNNKGHSVINGGKSTGEKKIGEGRQKIQAKEAVRSLVWLLLREIKGSDKKEHLEVRLWAAYQRLS